MNDNNKFSLPEQYKACETNIWIEYGNLARIYKPINLSQGAPDFNPPKILTDALKEVSNCDDYLYHQYARGFGYPKLVEILSKMYSPFFGKQINPLNEIIVTNGGTEALYCAILGFVKPEDEVIIIEPFFDCFDYFVKMARGVPKYIPLIPKTNSTSANDWYLDESKLESLFNPKTKMIIVNTPHNPTGKVFSEEELKVIAKLCQKWNVICVADEVYEWIIYDNKKHLRIGSFPEMWDRTITICSAGKTFSATGWKIGWAFGPGNLLHNLRVIHQNCVYTTCTPLQEAIARVLINQSELPENESYLHNFAKDFQKKRDFVAGFLKDIGLDVVLPSGGYFMLVNWTPLAHYADLESEIDKNRDYRFSKWMIKKIGLQVLPISGFYSEENKHYGENYVRICFIKNEENLQKAIDMLKKLK